jgi:glycosyltransferase involved in cell wall biosynthesis
MRLIVYVDSVYREVDGTIYGERAFTLFLAALGAEVDLIVLGRLDPAPGPARYALPAQVRFVPLPHYASLSRPGPALASLGASLRLFWRELGHADGALLFGPYLHAQLFTGVASLRRRTVVLGVRQDFPVYIRQRRPTTRWMHAVADALEWAWRRWARSRPTVVVGPELASRYKGARSLLPIAVSLITSADIAAGEQAAQRSYDGPLQLLSVGRLDEEKNPLLLADILKALRDADSRWRMVVCGEGPLAGAVQARMEVLGVGDMVELAGHVPISDGLMELYRSSHVFMHVSWTEGFPQVLIEAFAAGLPSVATAVGGVPGAVGDAALLVPPGDSRAAVRAAQRIAADAELRERLISAGLAEARRHTLELEVRRLVAFVRAAGSG